MFIETLDDFCRASVRAVKVAIKEVIRDRCHTIGWLNDNEGNQKGRAPPPANTCLIFFTVVQDRLTHILELVNTQGKGAKRIHEL